MPSALPRFDLLLSFGPSGALGQLGCSRNSVGLPGHHAVTAGLRRRGQSARSKRGLSESGQFHSEIGNCDGGSVITIDDGRDNNEGRWRRPMMADEHGEPLIEARRPTP